MIRFYFITSLFDNEYAIIHVIYCQEVPQEFVIKLDYIRVFMRHFY